MYIICRIDDTCKCQHVMNVVDYSIHFRVAGEVNAII